VSRDLIAVDSSEAFLSDTPTAVLIRQILGAVSQFDADAIGCLAAGIYRLDGTAAPGRHRCQ